MIRPLEYCETTVQISASIDVIDKRIEELIALKEQYYRKALELQDAEQATSDYTHANKEPTQQMLIGEKI